MGKRKAAPPPSDVRPCANIKSKKHPDVRCPLSATQGEFCTRHAKNPTRFVPRAVRKYSDELVLDTPSVSQTTAASRIQRCWCRFRLHKRFAFQGPATNFPECAENPTELYSLAPVTTIPLLYRWSYADSKKHIWLFDIRSLHAMLHTDSLQNPYTRETLSPEALTHLQKRTAWLRKQKYCLTHTEDEALSPEQIWHQKRLDMTLKYDALGYTFCLHWFENLSLPQLALLYLELWDLWSYRFQLPPSVKQQIVPNWNRADNLLFRWLPSELRGRTEKRWWQTVLVDVLEKLVSSPTKEIQSRGAILGMTGLALVSPLVASHYTWLVQE